MKLLLNADFYFHLEFLPWFERICYNPSVWEDSMSSIPNRKEILS